MAKIMGKLTIESTSTGDGSLRASTLNQIRTFQVKLVRRSHFLLLLFTPLTCHDRGQHQLVREDCFPCYLPNREATVSGSQEQVPIHLYPLTLRTRTDRFLLHALEDPAPFFVLKDAPKVNDIVPIVRNALNQGGNLLAVVAHDDPHRLVDVQWLAPEHVVAPRCPDRPDMTRSFWSKQRTAQTSSPALIRWVATLHGCASFRVSFFDISSYRWIHPEHPNASAMLDVAWRSIDEGMKVSLIECDDVAFSNYLCDLKPHAE